MKNALDRPVGRAETAAEGNRSRIWVVQYGPCWCRAEPPVGGSFDFVRFRTAEVEPDPLDRDILVVSARVIVGSERTLRQVHGRIPDPKLVVATGHCPATRPFWEALAGGWTPVEELIPVDLVVGECFSGKPETLLAAVLGSGQVALAHHAGTEAETVHS